MIRDCDVIPDRGLIEEERREAGYYDEPVPVEQARRVDDFLVAADDMEVVRRE